MAVNDDEMYGRAALSRGEPWIVPESLDYLRPLIKPNWEVFEWGSGGSTVFWSKHCKLVVSIEHNEEWITRTTQLLTRHNCLDNWLLQLVPGVGTDHETAFRNYADVILKFGKKKFDLIYVDGEASCRGWCLQHALSRVKDGGVLLLDNSDWLKGHEFGPEWDRRDFVAQGLRWVGQPGTFDWWTSVLRKV